MSDPPRQSTQGPYPVDPLVRLRTGYLVDPVTGCWVWQRAKNADGYGRMFVGSRVDGTRRIVPTHRLSYELHVGPIPEGLHLDHLCRNPPCLNPAHLEPVTHRENLLRGQAPAAVNARKTHCKRGHEFTPENTYVPRSGKRYCRECHRMRARLAVEVA